MKNLIILVLSILLFYSKYLNGTLIGLGRREEGDKILYKTYFRTEESGTQKNHTILISVTNENPITHIRFFPSTVLTTSSVTYNGSLIKLIEFTAYNTTNFHINMTVYGYDRPPEFVKTKSTLYHELSKLDRLFDSTLNSNSINNNNINNNNILNIHTNYNDDNASDITNGTDYDSNIDELFNVLATMKFKHFNLSITNDRLIPIYNQYNEKLLTNNNNNSVKNDTPSDGMDDIDPFFIQTLTFLLHTKQNYFNFWHNKNETSSASSLVMVTPLSPRVNINYVYLIYSLIFFMIL